jgi:hypothetical protein
VDELEVRVTARIKLRVARRRKEIYKQTAERPCQNCGRFHDRKLRQQL